ncbi:MAG: hypothetical protein Q9217_003730 [Psora testacea]
MSRTSIGSYSSGYLLYPSAFLKVVGGGFSRRAVANHAVIDLSTVLLGGIDGTVPLTTPGQKLARHHEPTSLDQRLYGMMMGAASQTSKSPLRITAFRGTFKVGIIGQGEDTISIIDHNHSERPNDRHSSMALGCRYISSTERINTRRVRRGRRRLKAGRARGIRKEQEEDFPETQQRVFDMAYVYLHLHNQPLPRLFYSVYYLEKVGQNLRLKELSSEQGLEKYEQTAVEDNVTDIIRQVCAILNLLKNNPGSDKEYCLRITIIPSPINAEEVRDHRLMQTPQRNLSQDTSSSSSRAGSDSIPTRTRADQFCVYKAVDGMLDEATDPLSICGSLERLFGSSLGKISNHNCELLVATRCSRGSFSADFGLA